MRRRTVGLSEDPVLSGMHTGAVQQGQLCPDAARVGRASQEGGLGGVSSPAAPDVSGSRKDWWPAGGLHGFAVAFGRPGAPGVSWALLSAGTEPRSCCWAPPHRPPASTCGEGSGRVGTVWGGGLASAPSSGRWPAPGTPKGSPRTAVHRRPCPAVTRGRLGPSVATPSDLWSSSPSQGRVGWC